MPASVSTLTWYLLITAISMFSQNVFVAPYSTGCVGCWRALNFSLQIYYKWVFLVSVTRIKTNSDTTLLARQGNKIDQKM